MWSRGQRETLRQDHNQLLSSCNAEQVKVFWRRCRPYRVAAEKGVGMDIFNPTLWSIEMPAAQAGAQTQTCIAGVLVLLLKDTTLEKHVQIFCEEISAIILHDLDEEEIDDESVLEAMITTLDVCKALCCLLSQGLSKSCPSMPRCRR